MPRIAIIGGGPAGLIAAEQLAAVDGLEVAVFDAMPSVGRKFLMAGKGRFSACISVSTKLWSISLKSGISKIPLTNVGSLC